MRATQGRHAARADRFVDWFIRTDYVASWWGGGDSWIEDPDRMERCERAAEDGAEGSTHAEVINDWREAFHAWIRDHHTGWSDLDRFTTAVNAHFDAVEEWHRVNGSLHEEIG